MQVWSRENAALKATQADQCHRGTQRVRRGVWDEAVAEQGSLEGFLLCAGEVGRGITLLLLNFVMNIFKRTGKLREKQSEPLTVHHSPRFNTCYCNIFLSHLKVRGRQSWHLIWNTKNNSISLHSHKVLFTPQKISSTVLLVVRCPQLS